MGDWRTKAPSDDISQVAHKFSGLSLETPQIDLKVTHSTEKYLILNILHNLCDDVSLINQQTLNSCKDTVLSSELFDYSPITKFCPPNWALLVETSFGKVDEANHSDFIQSIASYSNIPWRTALTAHVLLQRYCYILKRSEVEKPDLKSSQTLSQSYFSTLSTSTKVLLLSSCILIASKAEESLCRLSTIVQSIRSLLGDAGFVGIIPNDRQRRGSFSRDPDDAMSKAIKNKECNVLATLGFDIEVEHPHYYIKLLHLIALPDIELFTSESKSIIKKSFELLDKSQMDLDYPTSLFFKPSTMALAALYLSWFVVCIDKDEKKFHWSAFTISPDFKKDMKDFINQLFNLTLTDLEGWEEHFAPGECDDDYFVIREYQAGKCRSLDCYQKVEAICEGTYGAVWVAREIKTREKVALKQLKNTTGSNGFPYYMLREILFLRRLRHPNVVSGQEVLVNQFPTGDYEFYIVMEFISYDLRDIWIAQKDKTAYPLWNESNVKDLAFQLLSAIAYMHNRGLMHRDIKLENILFDDGVLKVADLGSIRDAGRTELKLTTAVVTLWYRPPELLLGNTVYTNSIDMWSVGCVLVELLAIQALFPGKDVDDMMIRIISCLGAPTDEELEKCFKPLQYGPKIIALLPRIPKGKTIETILKNYGPNCWDLIHRMLKYDPEQRISAQEALNHPYFKEEPLPSKYIPE